MRIQVAVPEDQVDKGVLDAALEAVTRLNEKLIEGGTPLFDEVRHRIRWQPEPAGQDEHFDHANTVLGRGVGDCDDMAPYAAASMRRNGEDPGARAVVYRSGPSRWHAVVERSDGSIRDPSRETGMGQPKGVSGIGLPPMGLYGSGVDGVFLPRPELAVRPVDDEGDAWEARLDIPWNPEEVLAKESTAMTTLHMAPTASQAIVGACLGGLDLGEDADGVDDEHLDRVEAIAGLLSGMAWEDLAEEFGEEHADAAEHVVGSLFGGITKALKKVVDPREHFKIAQKLTPKPLRGITKFADPTRVMKLANTPMGQAALSAIPVWGPAAAMAARAMPTAFSAMDMLGGKRPAGGMAGMFGGLASAAGGMIPGMGGAMGAMGRMPFAGMVPGMGAGMPFGGGMPRMPMGFGGGMPFGMPMGMPLGGFRMPGGF